MPTVKAELMRRISSETLRMLFSADLCNSALVRLSFESTHRQTDVRSSDCSFRDFDLGGVWQRDWSWVWFCHKPASCWGLSLFTLTHWRPRPRTLATWKQNYRSCPTVLGVFRPSLISTIRPLAPWLLQRSLINIFSSNYPSISGQDSSQMLLSHLPPAPRSGPPHPSKPPLYLQHPPHQRWYLPFSHNPLSEVFPYTLRVEKKKSYLFLGSTRAIKQGGWERKKRRRSWQEMRRLRGRHTVACSRLADWIDSERFPITLINFCVAFQCANVTCNRRAKMMSSYTRCPTPDWLSLRTMTFDLSCLFGVY